MKRSLLSVLGLLLMAAGQAFSQSQPAPGFLTAEWQRAKEFTLEYLAAMPEDGYNFKPTPEMRTFAQQFLHLAIDNYGFTATITGKSNPYSNSDETEKDSSLQSKAAVTKFVADSYDYAINGVAGLTPAQLQEKIGKRNLSRELYLFKAFEHQTHHRGQATVYLRLKGVKPPNEKLF